jgi:hypothetical protein
VESIASGLRQLPLDKLRLMEQMVALNVRYSTRLARDGSKTASH